LVHQDGASQDYDLNSIQTEATRLGVRIFSYTLGNGADQTVPKSIACQNGGVYQHVPDCGDLGSAMASYFKVLAAGISKIRNPQPRWVNYFGYSTGDEEFLSGCLPVFKNEGAAPGQVRELLGATCIDLNIIVPISTLQTMDCWGDFWTLVTTETRKCTPYTLTEIELEDLRAAIAPEAVCETTTPGSEYCPPTSTSSNAPECEELEEKTEGNAAVVIVMTVTVVVVLALLALACKLCCADSDDSDSNDSRGDVDKGETEEERRKKLEDRLAKVRDTIDEAP
jgi:hypothetical protein